jgi:hypothetical protein
MLINGANLDKKIIEIVERETQILNDVNSINERYATARNLHNMQEMANIEKDGKEVERRLNMHFVEKIMAMTMFVSKNRHFAKN